MFKFKKTQNIFFNFKLHWKCIFDVRINKKIKEIQNLFGKMKKLKIILKSTSMLIQTKCFTANDKAQLLKASFW